MIRLLLAAVTLLLGGINVDSAVEIPFLKGVEVGRVSANPIREASGLASSRINANVLYTHNDKGDKAQFFAINTEGDLLGILSLASATNVDYEDIAIGPGPVADTSYIYVADIGNNFFADKPRPNIVIYRCPEPLMDANSSQDQSTILSVDALTLYYPIGAHDAETLLLDPIDGKLYIITKRNGNNYVYRTAELWGEGDAEQTLEYATRMDNADDATGGDISSDGSEILIKNNRKVVYFRRDPSSVDLAGVLEQPGLFLPYEQELQGEAVTFATDGKGYYTLSEAKAKSSVPLLYYARNGGDDIEPSGTPTKNPTRSPIEMPSVPSHVPTATPVMPPKTLSSPLVTNVRILRRRIWLHLSDSLDPVRAQRIDNCVLFSKDQQVGIKSIKYLPPKSDSSAPRILLIASLFNKNSILEVGISRDIIDASIFAADVKPGYAHIASVGSGKRLQITESDGDAFFLQIRGGGLINYVQRRTNGNADLNLARTSKVPYESVLEGAVLSSSTAGDGKVVFDSLSVDRTLTSTLDPSYFSAGPLSNNAKEHLYLKSNGTLADILV